MKLKFLYSLILLCACISVQAQKKRKSALFIDSTARRHELQLNVGTLAGAIFSHVPNGATIDLTYARVYNGTHYLRTGIGVNASKGPEVLHSKPPYNPADTLLPYPVYASQQHTSVWGKVGYEISIGKRKTRFLFGADLLVGYYTGNSTTRSDYAYIPDSSAGSYYRRDAARGLTVGVNPRASVRYNFSKLFSGGITMGLLVGSYISLKRQVLHSIDDMSGYHPYVTTGFDLRFKPELNLVFKIP